MKAGLAMLLASALGNLCSAAVWASEFAYVSADARNSIAVVDLAIDAMVDEIPLGVGVGEIAVTRDGGRAYVADGTRQALTSVALPGGTVAARIPVFQYPAAVLLTPDERTAYVSGEYVVEVDLQTGDTRRLLRTSFPHDMGLSPDGRLLYVSATGLGEAESGVVVIDRETGSQTFGANEFWGGGLALSPDGSLLALTGERPGRAEGRLRLYDTATLRLRSDVALEERAGGVAVSPDGETVWALSSSNLRGTWLNAVNASTGRLRKRIAVRQATQLRMASSGAWLYVASAYFDGALWVVDLTTETIAVTRAFVQPLFGLALSGDERTLYTSARNGLYRIDAATLAGDVIAPNVVAPAGLAVSRDGAALVVAGGGSGNVAVIDTATRQIRGAAVTGGAPDEVALTPDGRRALVSSRETAGRVFDVDVESATLRDTIDVPPGASGIAVTPDGRRLVVASFGAGVTSTIDLATNALLGSAPSYGPKGVAVSPDGTRAFVAAEQPDALDVFDLAAGDAPRVDGSLALTATTPCALAMRADGSRLYAAALDGGVVQAVDWPSGELRESPLLAAPYAPQACGIALSSDQQRVYVANYSNSLMSVLDADDLHALRHIPVLPYPNRIAIGCSGGCPSPPPPPTDTPAPPPSATPTRAACGGDCGGDGRITVDELVTAVGIALEAMPLARCPVVDLDGDGAVRIAELVAAVNGALLECTGGG